GVDNRTTFHLDMSIEHLKRRRDVLGSTQNVENIDVWSAQIVLQHESQLDFDAGVRVFFPLEDVAGLEDLVVKNDAVVGLIDAGCGLHRFGCAPDFMAGPAASGFNLAICPNRLN